MFSSLYQRSGCNLSILMLQMFINDYMIKILITHPPLWMQLYGDAGVFVPDESDPSAWHWDYDVESHSVGGIKWIFLRSPAVVVAPGHLHVAQCQGDCALFRTAQAQRTVWDYFKLPDLTIYAQ